MHESDTSLLLQDYCQPCWENSEIFPEGAERGSMHDWSQIFREVHEDEAGGMDMKIPAA